MSLRKERTFSAAKSTAIVMAAMILSKLTGFIREIAITPTLGYGYNTDAYFIGFQIPDLIYQLMIGGAIGAAITPTVSSELECGGEKRVWRSVSIFMNVFLLGTLVAILLGELLAPAIIRSYNADKSLIVIERAIGVTRALFPQIVFLMAGGFLSGILQGYRLFHRSAFGPVIYNIVCIIFIFMWGDTTASGPAKAAAGVVIASVVNFVFMLFMTGSKLRYYQPVISLRDSGFRELWRLALPTLISGSVMQINVIVQTAFANQFPGAVTALQHCTTTWMTPYGVMAVAVSSVMMPTLSAKFVRRDYLAMRRVFSGSLRKALYMIMPFALAFMLMPAETIEGIFQWKQAIPYDRLLIEARMLRIYAIPMLFQTVILLYNNAFYASKVTRVSLLTSLISLVMNPLFTLLFTRVFHFGILGLPMAYALNSLLVMLFLRYVYRAYLPSASPRRLGRFMVRLGITSLPMAVVLMAFNTLPINVTGKAMQIVFYAIKFLFGLFVYYLSGLAIGLREARYFQSMIRRVLRLRPLN